jgi:hypothetical protein
VSDSGVDEEAVAGAVFGALKRVAANAGWAHEAHAFTPWLADNLDLLGDALGLSLEIEQREYPVGRYSLDLLLSDFQERVVIVENQFAQTDHDHLGKLVTYCAGTDAEAVIWIAEHINEEHAAALEWLNEKMVQGIGFFGMELELLQIDDSRLAPHFRVLVQPNEWTKRVRPVSKQIDWSWEKYGEELQIPGERIAVGRVLIEQLEEEVSSRALPWQVVFRKGYSALQRAGGYNVVIVDLYWKKAPRLAIKIPDSPEVLGLVSPYPALEESWSSTESEWGWTVPSVDHMLKIRAALDLATPFHPESGPMTVPSPDAG